MCLIDDPTEQNSQRRPRFQFEVIELISIAFGRCYQYAKEALLGELGSEQTTKHHLHNSTRGETYSRFITLVTSCQLKSIIFSNRLSTKTSGKYITITYNTKLLLVIV